MKLLNRAINIKLGVIFILLVLSSCTENVITDNEIIFTDESFQQNYELTSEKCEINLLSTPSALYLVDSLLLFKYHSSRTIIHAYDTLNYNLKQKIFNVGRGPDEFMLLYSLQKEDSLLWVFDIPQSKISAFKTKDLFLEQKIKSTQKVHFKNTSLSSVVKLRNGIFAGTNTISNELITFFDKKGNVDTITYKNKIDYPFELPDDLSGIDKYYLGMYKFDYNNDLDKLLLLYDLHNIAEIYDMSDATLYKRFIGPNIEEIDKDKRKTIYTAGFITNNNIYLFYDGTVRNKKNGNVLNDCLPIMYKFDMNGEPICKYSFDKKIRSVSFDAENNIIYGLHDTTNGTELLKYVIVTV